MPYNDPFQRTIWKNQRKHKMKEFTQLYADKTPIKQHLRYPEFLLHYIDDTDDWIFGNDRGTWFTAKLNYSPNLGPYFIRNRNTYLLSIFQPYKQK